MARTITSKVINLHQLDVELGGQGLSTNDNDPTAIVIVTADESTVTQAQLEAGVAAHVAIPYVDPDAATRTSGRIHALSLGYTQAQAEVLFP